MRKTGPQLYTPIPNPADDHTTLEYYLPNFDDVRMTIYDLSGRFLELVMQENSIAPGFYKQQINVSKYAPGMYLCTLEANGKRVTKSFVVQH